MKCPQCGYISFDYLDTCKKCGNNLTPVRDLLDITPVSPNPPFLLASLVGAEEMLESETSEAKDAVGAPPELTVEPDKEISLDVEGSDISFELEAEEKPDEHE